MHANILKACLAALALTASHAAPTPSNDNTGLIKELITTPNQILRYQKLLTDASGSQLLADEALAKATVFDFTQHGVNITGSNGGQNSGVRPSYRSFFHSANKTPQATVESFPLLFGSGLSVMGYALGARCCNLDEIQLFPFCIVG
jgi:hypothetical protein